MAITNCVCVRGIPGTGKRKMTADEFKKWLTGFDVDRDGRISRKELQEAIRRSGVWFSSHKSVRGVLEADANGSGYIDDGEIDNLLDFAEQYMGVRIVAY